MMHANALPWIDYSAPAKKATLIREWLALREPEYSEAHGRQLGSLYLFLTNQCNLACEHCYIVRSRGNGQRALDVATLQTVIERAIPYGLERVKISGGEPFMRRDLFDALTMIHSFGLAILLETNGTLFRSDTASRLRSYGNLSVSLSLDDVDEQRHDAFRGSGGSWRKTIAALQDLSAFGVNCTVTTVANKHNYSRIGEIVDRCIGWGATQHRTLLNIHPLGSALKHPDNALTLDECRTVISALLENANFQANRAQMTLPLALQPTLSLPAVVRACGWSRNVVGVLSNGDVSMCSASYGDPQMIAGNVFRQDLIELWQSAELFARLRRIADGDVRGVCGNCVFYRICQGVCRMSSYAHYGRLDAPYPLCQELYNEGAFPAYALVDGSRDSSYGAHVLQRERCVAEENSGRTSKHEKGEQV